MTDDEIRGLFVRLSDPWGRGWRTMTQALLEAEGADLAEVFAWVEKVGGKPEPIEGPAPGLRPDGPRVEQDYGVRYVVPADALGL